MAEEDEFGGFDVDEGANLSRGNVATLGGKKGGKRKQRCVCVCVALCDILCNLLITTTLVPKLAFEVLQHRAQHEAVTASKATGLRHRDWAW